MMLLRVLRQSAEFSMTKCYHFCDPFKGGVPLQKRIMITKPNFVSQSIFWVTLHTDRQTDRQTDRETHAKNIIPIVQGDCCGWLNVIDSLTDLGMRGPTSESTSLNYGQITAFFHWVYSNWLCDLIAQSSSVIIIIHGTFVMRILNKKAVL